jgi:hypothetical protein
MNKVKELANGSPLVHNGTCTAARKMACRLASPGLTGCLLPLSTNIPSFTRTLRSKSRRNVRNSLRRNPTDNSRSNISRGVNRLDRRFCVEIPIPRRRHSRQDHASSYSLRRRGGCESESRSDDIGIVA